MSDDLEGRALALLREMFDPLPVRIERSSRRSWMVVLGREAHLTTGLTLTKRKDNLHEAIHAVRRLVRGVGWRRLVEQLARATGGRPIVLPEQWYDRRMP